MKRKRMTKKEVLSFFERMLEEDNTDVNDYKDSAMVRYNCWQETLLFCKTKMSPKIIGLLEEMPDGLMCPRSFGDYEDKVIEYLDK